MRRSKLYEREFEQAESHLSLARTLHKDQDKTLAFFLLRSGRDRFDLVNNYSLNTFSQILETIAGIAPHQEPLRQFEEALRETGLAAETVNRVIGNLRRGTHPLRLGENPMPARSFRLDVSELDVIRSQNQQVGDVLSKNQMGACLKASLYRIFLKAEKTPPAQKLLDELEVSPSLAARVQVLQKIEEAFPLYSSRAAERLKPNWKKLGAKLPFTVSAENVLMEDRASISCEQLIASIETQRLSLQNAAQQSLTALRGQNPEIQRVSAEINRKERAAGALARGVSRNPALQSQIDEIEKEAAALKVKKEELLNSNISNRFDHLSEEERQKVLKEERQKLSALGSKDSSAIFACMVLETLGDAPITERDSELIKEVASHLQHPFEVVRRAADLDDRGRPRRAETAAMLRFIEKKDDLMTMVRCADSKPCCFASTNYNMRVAHGIPNQYWVASLFADPLSFCFAIERPALGESASDTRTRRENIGFVFGTFGVADGKPILCLNGVYLAPGNGAKSVEAVLNQIEHDLARPLRMHAILMGSQHGGAISGKLEGYQKETNVITRLRALADARGEPERRIYDDFSTSINTSCDVTALTKWLEY